METAHDRERIEKAPETAIRMNLALQTVSRARILARRLPVDFAITAAFNVVCAVIVTYLMRIGDSFMQSLVFSMCIGTLALLFINGGRLLLWGDCKPPKLPFLLLLTMAAPAAWQLGSRIATGILGIAPESLAVVQSQNTIGFFVLTILACVAVTWFFWNRGKLQQLAADAETEKARAAAIEKQAMQAQLQLLQAQIEPHMLFNTLANLQGLIAIDPPRAQHMLEQLILYLRATLSSSRAEKTTLANEFSLTEAYLGLMSLRMGPRLSYALQLPDTLRHMPVPPMLLQPLVENAIKHGLEPKIGSGHLEVRAVQEADLLKLIVADTGLGLEASPAKHSGTQVGLANVRERMQALYGQRASLSLLPNTPSGVIAQLAIPL
jgi:hypothetical protein